VVVWPPVLSRVCLCECVLCVSVCACTVRVCVSVWLVICTITLVMEI
jgi:hypothetical protein